MPRQMRIFHLGSFGKIEVYGRNREEAVSFRHPKGDANGRERRQKYFYREFPCQPSFRRFTPKVYLVSRGILGFHAHVSMIHAHALIFPHFLKTRYRALEGLDGLEAFFHCEPLFDSPPPVAGTPLRGVRAVSLACPESFSG